MGGKALLPYGIETERKTTKEFIEIGQIIQNDFKDKLDVITNICSYYRNKESHGDLDLLVKIDHNFNNKHIDLRDFIQKQYKPKAIHSNGGVYSFDYNNFQVDIIPVKESNWEVAIMFFSNDPFPNAAGKVYHKFGLSFGFDGLKYKFRNFNGNLSQDIMISKNPRKIFEFGDYDYDRFLEGFDSLEDIFNYIISSKYFNIENFKYENLNHLDRKRNQRRNSYNQLLTWINENNIPNNDNEFNRDKTKYIDYIDSYFPEANFKAKLNALEDKDKLNKELSVRFNGNLIIQWTNGELIGKELGNSIKLFKESFGNSENFSTFVLNSDEDIIRAKFINFYEKTKAEK